MKTSEDLLSLVDLSNYFGVSESTIRRKVREHREGNGTFPLPLFKRGCRLLWKKSDITNWSGEDGETISFTPSPIPPIPQGTSAKNSAQIRQGLLALGVKLPTPSGNESNN